MIPFGKGNRSTEGIILARGTGEKVPGIKPLSAVLDQAPVLDSDGIALALWMRQRYFCTLFEAVKTILPSGLWYRFREIWSLTDPEMERAAADALAISVRRASGVLDVLYASNGTADLETLQDACGADVSATLRELKKAGVVACEASAKRKISDKKRRMVELAVSAEDALALTEASKRRYLLFYRRLHADLKRAGEGRYRGVYGGRSPASFRGGIGGACGPHRAE